MSTNRDDFGIAFRSALLQRGARQKFSLFFLICLSVLIFFLDSFPSKLMDNARSLLNDGIYRASSIGTSPFQFISYLGRQSKVHFSVHKENKKLKNELVLLRKKDFQLEFLTNQNKNLKSILKSEENLNTESVTAKVLLDKESPFLKSIIVNRGSRSGIKKGMPVVDGNYLIGRIVEVNFISSRVLLLNDLNSRIPISIMPSSTQAILTGAGEAIPKLEYLPEGFIAEDDQTVFTSGKDGIFSPGIPIGKTTKAQNTNEGPILKVKLFSDHHQLTFIKIVLNSSEEDTKF
jgi:rod shape-determining protein MreC